jgi:hypothetical protein
MHIITKQPNGLYCVISTIVEAPVLYNATAEEVVAFELEELKEIYKLQVERARNFEDNAWRITDMNMTVDEAENFAKAIGYDKPLNINKEEEE